MGSVLYLERNCPESLSLPEVRGEDADHREDLQATSKHEEAKYPLGENTRLPYRESILPDRWTRVADRRACDTDTGDEVILIHHQEGRPDKDQHDVHDTEG